LRNSAGREWPNDFRDSRRRGPTEENSLPGVRHESRIPGRLHREGSLAILRSLLVSFESRIGSRLPLFGVCRTPLAFPSCSDTDSPSLPLGTAVGGTTVIAEQQIRCVPTIRFFSGRSQSYFQFGSEWRRASAEDEAHAFTGFDHTTHEPSVGVYVERRSNRLLRIGFDLWRLSVNLCPAVIQRLQNRWRQESGALSKSLLRSAERRSHFSKSFARFEISPERLEAWKSELAAVLSNPDSYQRI
jgi:hypothetical protein